MRRNACKHTHSRAQELSEAVATFRTAAQTRQQATGGASSSRKTTAAPITTVAYSDCFGEGGSNATAAYLLASAFDKVYTAPAGMLALNGLATTTIFLRQLFDRLKIKPTFFVREEFKNFANQVISR